jgi:DNA-binding CsgD family transcriptional regulator
MADQELPSGERARIVLVAREPADRRPEVAPAFWDALFAGRLVLFDRFEREGRHFVVASARGASPARGPLSARERCAAEELGRGLAPKEIAYAHGVAASTVANALGRARRKLGLRSLAELAALFASREVCTALAGVELAGGGRVAVAWGATCVTRLVPLSAAEREVARLLVAGASNREIAGRRGAAVRTVANQARAIYRKLGVASRAELAAHVHRAIA